MNTRRGLGAILRVAMAALAGQGVAWGDLYQWRYARGDNPPNLAIDESAGEILGVEARYDTSSQRLSWYVDFGSVPGYPGLTTRGFTLLLNAGPSPSGRAGELALFYFDATPNQGPVLSVHGYNGRNTQESYRDGHEKGGVQPPDRILSSLSGVDWVEDLSVLSQDNGVTRLGFTVDVSAINSHVPRYHADRDEWFGTGFGPNLGAWMNPVAELTTAYGSNGFLSDWRASLQGGLEGHDLSATLVPVPGAAALALLGLGGVGWVRRGRARDAA